MDLNILISVVTVAVFVSILAASYALLLPRFKRRALLKQRLSIASGNINTDRKTQSMGAGGNRRKNIQLRLKQLEAAKTKKSFTVKMQESLRLAGLETSLRNYLLFCSGLTVLVGLVCIAMGYHPFGIVTVAITIGFGLPRYLLSHLRKRRVKQFTKEFANAVDIIVRGIKSGLPVGECLGIIAAESPEPVAGVFLKIVESQNVGLSLDVAMERAQEHIRTPELQFFAIVISIQAQTGGNLAETLSNLSKILRDRKRMADKVKALSSEAKSSASIIGSLPFIIGGLLYLVNPDYMVGLFTADLGKMLLVGGAIWMSIGILVMKQMINFEF